MEMRSTQLTQTVRDREKNTTLEDSRRGSKGNLLKMSEKG